MTARYYNSDLPFSATFGARGASWTRPLAEYYADAALGQLPNITFVDPPFHDGGGFDGNSADEHPHGDVRLGQAWMADVVKAFVESPNYERGALFVIYDEWGGFFDHVTPPSVPDDRQSADLDQDFGQMGFRIPAVTISPFTRNLSQDPVRVDHGQYGTESILKLIMYRFGLDFDRSPRGRRADARGQREQRGRELRLEEPELRACPTCRSPSTSCRSRARSAAATCSTPRARPRTSPTSRTSRSWPTGSGSRPATASRTSCSASRTRSRKSLVG